MLQHTHHHVAVAELVVVPGDELHEVVVQHDAGLLIEHAGAGIGDQVRGHHLVGGVADDVLHIRLGGVANGVADLGIGGGPGQAGGQVHHGHVGGGDPEGHAGHLALQAGDHPAHGLGRAGGGGDDVVEDGAAGAPVAAAPGVHGLLLGSGGVDGGHQALLDAELLVDDLGQRGQAVGGAAGVGDDHHVRLIQLAVDAVYKGGSDLVLGGSGQQNLLGAALEVAGGLLRGVVGAGGLDDVLRAALTPGDHGRVRLAEHPDLVAVDHQVAALMLHGAVEPAEHGVVFQQIDHIIHVCFPQVDAADLILIGLLRQNAQDHPADAAETIDTDLDSHNLFPFYIRPQGAVFLFRLYYTKWARFMSPIFVQNGAQDSRELFVTFEHPEQKNQKYPPNIPYI